MEKKVIKKSKIAKNVTKVKKTNSSKERLTRETKKSVPEVEPFGVRAKRFLASYGFLYTTFSVLFVVVIALVIMVVTKSNEQDVNKSDIVFSILDKNTNSSLKVNLKDLAGRKYVLKVSNYRGDTLCEEEVPYKIHVTNSSSAKIEILKDGGADNLMIDQKKTIIESPALGCSKKSETVYYFMLLDSEKVKDDDVIKIDVVS